MDFHQVLTPDTYQYSSDKGLAFVDNNNYDCVIFTSDSGMHRESISKLIANF